MRSDRAYGVMVESLVRGIARWGAAAVGLGIALSASPAAAQAVANPGSQETEETPTGDEVLAAYVDAIGGEEAVFAIDRREVRGRYEGPPFEFPARLRVWFEAPSKMRLTLSEPGGLEIEYGHTGEAIWQSVSGSEPQHVYDPVRRIAFREDADIYQEANYKERYERLIRRGLSNFRGRTLIEILAIPGQEGRQRLLYFDPDTDLLVGSVLFTLDEERQPIRLFTTYNDYKEFGGVKFATTIAQQFEGSDATVVYTIDEMIINGPAHDFSPPEGLGPYDPPEAAQPENNPGGEETSGPDDSTGGGS